MPVINVIMNQLITVIQKRTKGHNIQMEVFLSSEKRGALRRHRRSQEYGDEMEERYSISRVGGINGQWIFTCKTCEAPFISQRSVKEHDTAKHGGGWNVTTQ